MRHRWRLYVAEDLGFEVSQELSAIVPLDHGHIDQWFEGDLAVFSGTGPTPQDPHLERISCRDCHTSVEVCDLCCGTGFVLRWCPIPTALVEEAVTGLRSIISELEEHALV